MQQTKWRDVPLKLQSGCPELSANECVNCVVIWVAAPKPNCGNKGRNVIYLRGDQNIYARQDTVDVYE